MEHLRLRKASYLSITASVITLWSLAWIFLIMFRPNTVDNSMCLDVRGIPEDFLHISIKTGNANHNTRMIPIMKTWIPIVQKINHEAGFQIMEKVQVVTDTFLPASDMESLAKLTSIRVHASHCPSGHDGISLHCKTYYEFKHYYQSEPLESWYCHVDDDVYVNIPNLIRMLQRFNYSEPHFLAKALHFDAEDKMGTKPRHFSLLYASGPFFCLSRSLMLLFEPIMLLPKHMLNYRDSAKRYNEGKDIGDDILLSLISSEYLNVSVTHVNGVYDEVLSNPDVPRLQNLTLTQILSAVTLSYGKKDDVHVNLGSNREFPRDPTKFLQLHEDLVQQGSQRTCQHKLITTLLKDIFPL